MSNKESIKLFIISTLLLTAFFKSLILKLMGKLLPILILIAVVLIIGFIIIQRSPYKNDILSVNPKVEAVYAGTIPCADCPGINEKKGVIV